MPGLTDCEQSCSRSRPQPQISPTERSSLEITPKDDRSNIKEHLFRGSLWPLLMPKHRADRTFSDEITKLSIP